MCVCRIQAISVVAVKFLPWYRTEFPDFCSVLFCFLLGYSRLQHFLWRESGQLESFLHCKIILLSSFHAFIMEKASFSSVNECSHIPVLEFCVCNYWPSPPSSFSIFLSYPANGGQGHGVMGLSSVSCTSVLLPLPHGLNLLYHLWNMCGCGFGCGVRVPSDVSLHWDQSSVCYVLANCSPTDGWSEAALGTCPFQGSGSSPWVVRIHTHPAHILALPWCVLGPVADSWGRLTWCSRSDPAVLRYICSRGLGPVDPGAMVKENSPWPQVP